MPEPKIEPADGPKLKLGILWHQHQPYYKNLLTGEYILPWVRLHGVKDYLDMVEILAPYPSIKQTFNMVPSLLEQLDDYSQGIAIDPHLALSLKKAEELSQEEKKQMTSLLFQAHYETMIGTNRRYSQLFKDRDRALSTWSDAEWRDLQALANLAWIDPSFKKTGRLQMLDRKGERYTEEEKQEILDSHKNIIRKIAPTLKEYMTRGQIEVSVTPYFHPIMPLLYDTSSALVAMPGAPMPQQRFQHPEDVDRQVRDAIELYQDLFGRRPLGMWPSEGSVSEEIIPILFNHGIKWIATDEEILAASLGVPSRTSDPNSLITSGQLCRGYLFEKEPARMVIFFRDHALSDNIGFVYSGWDPEKAADDFMGKLAAVRRNLIEKRIRDPIISVILDGENAWEYYRNDGHDFLNALYTRIEAASWLETVTFGQYIDQKPNLGQLKKLFPGSWINHNFSVWIGHAEDNKAWDMLSRTRNELVAFEKATPGFAAEKLELAWKEVFIAEGSDWCWWFGEDHVGPNNDDFDRLFRSHLSNVYRLTDREPPAELLTPIRSNYIDAHFTKPIDFIKPVIDGRITHYYEWLQAGHFDCAKAGSTMHKAERLVAGIWFGYDQNYLYFRIDRSVTVTEERFGAFVFEIEFYNAEKTTVTIQAKNHIAKLNSLAYKDIIYALKDTLEIAIPFLIFRTITDSLLLARIAVKEEDKVLEIWPPAETLRIELPNPHDIPWVV